MHYLTDSLSIYVYALPVLDSRMYIVVDKQQPAQALVIDPIVSEEAVPILTPLSHATVLLTHSHIDHISGVNWLRTKTDVSVLCSTICAEKIADPNKNLAAFSAALVMDKTKEEQATFLAVCDTQYSCKADDCFDKATEFTWGSHTISITHTPGHSDCSQCIRLTPSSEQKLTQGLQKKSPTIVFTGDSLVNGHKVVTRLPSGSKTDYQTITKPYLTSLSQDTLIMPGHGDWDILAHYEW